MSQPFSPPTAMTPLPRPIENAPTRLPDAPVARMSVAGSGQTPAMPEEDESRYAVPGPQSIESEDTLSPDQKGEPPGPVPPPAPP